MLCCAADTCTFCIHAKHEYINIQKLIELSWYFIHLQDLKTINSNVQTKQDKKNLFKVKLDGKTSEWRND